jgi:hypothetical protein
MQLMTRGRNKTLIIVSYFQLGRRLEIPDLRANGMIFNLLGTALATENNDEPVSKMEYAMVFQYTLGQL